MSKKISKQDFLTGFGHIEKDLAEYCTNRNKAIKVIKDLMDELDVIEDCMIHKLDDLYTFVNEYMK